MTNPQAEALRAEFERQQAESIMKPFDFEKMAQAVLASTTVATAVTQGDAIRRAADAIMAAKTRNATFADFIHDDEAMSAARAVIAALPQAGEVEPEEPTWPEWASELLNIMREYTGPCPEDGYEGVDLPEELRTWFEGYRDELIRASSLAKSSPSSVIPAAAERAKGALDVLGWKLEMRGAMRLKVEDNGGVGTATCDEAVMYDALEDIAASQPQAGPSVNARKVAEKVATAVMVWAAPHFKHMVSFNTLCEAIEPEIIAALPTPSEGLTERYRAALRPFGEFAEVILSEAPPYAHDIAIYTDHTGRMHKITMDQLRAVSALATPEKDAQ